MDQTPPKTLTLEVRVTGRVQGVWFRGWTQREARRLGLVGWARNEPDGSVLVLMQGPAPRVEEMLAALHRGPEAAVVRDVRWEVAQPLSGRDFDIRR